MLELFREIYSSSCTCFHRRTKKTTRLGPCKLCATMNAAAVRIIGAAQRRCAQTLGRPALLLPPVSSSAVQFCLQSTQPVPAARLPYRVKVSAGKRYAWCACGHSKKQPFCDGAHRTDAPSISPVRFTPDKDRTLMLCACKQTKNAPYCDGSHLKVIFQDVVKSVKGIFK